MSIIAVTATVMVAILNGGAGGAAAKGDPGAIRGKGARRCSSVSPGSAGLLSDDEDGDDDEDRGGSPDSAI
ncbi:hypothetical protein N7470_009038 [Penicillium chermesinum]|nr:hypothetical protein N7470_009038 [Penicillium chermesinum]